MREEQQARCADRTTVIARRTERSHLIDVGVAHARRNQLALICSDGTAMLTRSAVQIRALTGAEAATIASWRYPGRYSTYDVDDPSILARDHWAVTDAGELVGYCCFGAPARVAGASEDPGTLDVGYGLAPSRMGRGQGGRFVAAILEFAREQYDTQRFRLYILEWNERSKKLAARLGFAVESVLQSDEGPFVVMVRKASGADSRPRQDVSD